MKFIEKIKNSFNLEFGDFILFKDSGRIGIVVDCPDGISLLWLDNGFLSANKFKRRTLNEFKKNIVDNYDIKFIKSENIIIKEV